MKVTLTSNSGINFNGKQQMNVPMKREAESSDFDDSGRVNEDKTINLSTDSVLSSDEVSDIEGGAHAGDSTNNLPLDYTENALSSLPVADLIKKEFIPEFDFGNSIFNQNMRFKTEDFRRNGTPFLLSSELYKNFLNNLGKRNSNNSLTDCYALYPRNILFSNGIGTEVSDDESNVVRDTDSPEEEVVRKLSPSTETEKNVICPILLYIHKRIANMVFEVCRGMFQKAGASAAFVWSGGGAGPPAQPAPQPADAHPAGVGVGAGGGGAQGLVHWMSVMAEHMGGAHPDAPYALPPWNNGAVDVRWTDKDVHIHPQDYMLIEYSNSVK
ncbi:hypothetical protein EVAR_6429_1 [Eumeta japonica]|uniref:Uncharacterized protein n=1 Tax=Eumeta variegata TaxID=151549 RepID=A0A4C1TCR4_EUMVA|nr:hypothetical protein EVAR_6429_1 [Eumeta japonica]